ncbi:heterokaryon incompatibility protein-domain-containing protein [Leptodontidium sp. MPI-SDFR-AT-0119]|nr:heterokaryon incompatibility protein-domain-containing protein [Leptodontidium sp. MPI-SDFR-AT-0119]
MHHKFELSSLIRTLFAFPRIPSYTYKPLYGPPDAIRLVILQPAPFITSPINCRIIETSWGAESLSKSKSIPTLKTTTTPPASQPSNKGYAALSYTWGTSSPSTPISIDGRPFNITPNLHTALQHLRSPRTETRLWADSLCIDQSSTSERNLHVTHMREIYSAARETLIFLGQGTPGSDALLHAIRDAGLEIVGATTRNAVVRCLVNASGMRKHELVHEAERILWRGYWKRIWIVQEIIVSENPIVQCGGVKVGWEVFCQALIALLMEVNVFGGGHGNLAKERLEAVYWERRAWRRKRGLRNGKARWDMRGEEEEGRMGLLDLLVSKRGAEATDSRDMVFAVSGLATIPKSPGSRPLSITYEKSAAGVYMDTVKYLLDHDGTGSYEILSHAGLHSHSSPKSSPTHQIPSWAPDWRHPSPYKTKIVDWIATSSIPTLVQHNHIYLPHHNSLVCIGHKHNIIQSISADTSDVKPAAGSIGRVIWVDKWRRRNLIEHGVLSNLGTKLGTVTGLVGRCHPLTLGRKVASLKGGVLALVPSEARVGDVVAGFVGSGVPFVVRDLGRGDHERDDWGGLEEEALSKFSEMDREGGDLGIGHYHFVGECFVDGLMSIETRDWELKKKEAFCLH